MGGLYHLMIKEAQGYQTFKSLNGRDILDFPFHVPLDINEKYVIPQFLTTFIREEHKEIDGIKYYTLKNKNLNPFGTGEENMIRRFDWG